MRDNENHIFIKEPKGYILKYWHLVASNGKLLMVKKTKHAPAKVIPGQYKDKIEVLEADMDVGAWVPAAAASVHILLTSMEEDHVHSSGSSQSTLTSVC